MNFKKIFSCVLLIVALCIAAASMALADDDTDTPTTPIELSLSAMHNTWAGLINGKSNYNSATFIGTYIELANDEGIELENTENIPSVNVA